VKLSRTLRTAVTRAPAARRPDQEGNGRPDRSCWREREDPGKPEARHFPRAPRQGRAHQDRRGAANAGASYRRL